MEIKSPTSYLTPTSRQLDDRSIKVVDYYRDQIVNNQERYNLKYQRISLLTLAKVTRNLFDTSLKCSRKYKKLKKQQVNDLLRQRYFDPAAMEVGKCLLDGKLVFSRPEKYKSKVKELKTRRLESTPQERQTFESYRQLYEKAYKYRYKDMNALFEDLAVFNSGAQGLVYKPKSNAMSAFLIKTPISYDKLSFRTLQHIYHEILTGLSLNFLRSSIPNFMYTYGYFRCNKPALINSNGDVNVCTAAGQRPFQVVERIPGQKLSTFLQDNNVSFEDVLNIYLQILMSLQAANYLEFSHNDLHTGNMMVRELSDPVTIKYELNGQFYYLTTRYIVVLIDFGYAVWKMPRYGYISPKGLTDYGVYPDRPNYYNDAYRSLLNIMYSLDESNTYEQLKDVLKLLVVFTPDSENETVDDYIQNSVDDNFIAPPVKGYSHLELIRRIVTRFPKEVETFMSTQEVNCDQVMCLFDFPIFKNDISSIDTSLSRLFHLYAIGELGARLPPGQVTLSSRSQNKQVYQDYAAFVAKFKDSESEYYAKLNQIGVNLKSIANMMTKVTEYVDELVPEDSLIEEKLSLYDNWGKPRYTIGSIAKTMAKVMINLDLTGVYLVVLGIEVKAGYSKNEFLALYTEAIRYQTRLRSLSNRMSQIIDKNYRLTLNQYSNIMDQSEFVTADRFDSDRMSNGNSTSQLTPMSDVISKSVSQAKIDYLSKSGISEETITNRSDSSSNLLAMESMLKVSSDIKTTITWNNQVLQQAAVKFSTQTK